MRRADIEPNIVQKQPVTSKARSNRRKRHDGEVYEERYVIPWYWKHVFGPNRYFYRRPHLMELYYDLNGFRHVKYGFKSGEII